MALPTLGVLDKDEVARTINTPNSGRQDAASSQAAVLSTEDKAALDAVTAAIVGTIAHDDADAGNGSKIAAKAKAGLSGVTPVAGNDRSDLYSSLDGALAVRSVLLEDIVAGAASNTDGTSTAVIAAAGAGIKQYLTHVSLSNTNASTSVMVALKSGAVSRWRVNVPPGGREMKFDPPLPPNAADEAWSFDPDSAVTTIECAMLGFKSKV